MDGITLPLAVAGACSAACALLHVLIVFGGGPWYRFFGAGERMASASEAGRAYPAVVTLGIAAVFAVWGAYAFAVAGVLALALPWQKAVLSAITAIYLLRGLGLLVVFAPSRVKYTPFDLWSSAVSATFGLVHLLGLWQVWPTLGPGAFPSTYPP